MRKGFKKAKAKHGLNKTWIRANLVSFLRDQTVEREGRGKERRRGRGREEEENRGRRREVQARPKRYGTTWAFKALNGFPCNCMVISCLQT